MSNILTDWRCAVVEHLAANLQNGSFEVESGERDGLSRDKKRAVVFAPTTRSESSNVNFARPVLLVRCWLKQPRQPKGGKPRDPGPIEQLMVDLATTLETIQVLPDLASGPLYFIVTEIQPDYEDWGVQATLVGWMRNPATT